MALAKASILERRGDQMLPELAPFEIERVRRFGECRTFTRGAMLYTIGQVAPGLMVILSGKVEVSQVNKSGRRTPIVTHGPGHFLGELAQLANRPSLADAVAQDAIGDEAALSRLPLAGNRAVAWVRS